MKDYVVTVAKTVATPTVTSGTIATPPTTSSSIEVEFDDFGLDCSSDNNLSDEDIQ
ncbi:hypothetical protein TIFTF001_023035 [Ficus carica]|uniref:Uncharacterized protein n=1 Tax=Ficus carica TaxID=3494 RepID=A0AA88DDB1_FICCA|nr:hypothetical protein TIFTF001_023035 [Ficus carica]